MARIEDDIFSMMALIVMFLTIITVLNATDGFRIFQGVIAFTFAFVLFYITRRTVYIEIKKEEK